MSIARVDYPINLTAQADFSAHGELIETRFTDQVNAPQWVVSGNIPQGVVLQIGGVVYRADSDTAITGTASAYVRVTPAGATASAAYVADLTGVSWSAQYNGYYDASENLYLFDEGKALAAGQISAVFGRYLMQQPNGDVQVGRNLAAEGDVSAGGNATVGGTLGVTGNVTVGGTLNADGDLLVDGLMRLAGRLEPRAASYTEVSIASGTTYVVPRGVYFGYGAWSVFVDTECEIYNGSTWLPLVNQPFAGAIISDGTNVRFRNEEPGAAVVLRLLVF